MRESLWEKLTKDDRALIYNFWRKSGDNLAPLLAAFGLKLELQTLDDEHSGCLVYDPGNDHASNYTLIVNKRHSKTRQRFTAAHELAHYLLHRRDEVFCASLSAARGSGYDTFYTDDDNKEETEADAFAAALLMPMKEFESAYIDEKLHVKDLSKRFWVSEAAVKRRVEDVWRRRL